MAAWIGRLGTVLCGTFSVDVYLFSFLWLYSPRRNLQSSANLLIKISPHLFTELGGLTELLVGGATALYWIIRRHRRGKRSGVLVKLKQGVKLCSSQFIGPMSAFWPTRWINCCSSTEYKQTFGERLPCSLSISGLVSTSRNKHYITTFNSSEQTAQRHYQTREGRFCFYTNKGWCADCTVLRKS